MDCPFDFEKCDASYQPLIPEPLPPCGPPHGPAVRLLLHPPPGFDIIPKNKNWRIEQKQLANARVAVDFMAHDAMQGLKLICESERLLLDMSKKQSFAGLLYASPHFKKGIYKFSKGYRHFINEYIKVYPTSSRILKNVLDVKKCQLEFCTGEIQIKIDKLQDWLNVYINIRNIGQEVKQKAIKGIQVCQNMKDIISELQYILSK